MGLHELPWWQSGLESAASAGDMGLIPGPGRSHMLLEQLSPGTTTTEAACSRARALQQESRCNKTVHQNENIDPTLRN